MRDVDAWEWIRRFENENEITPTSNERWMLRALVREVSLKSYDDGWRAGYFAAGRDEYDMRDTTPEDAADA